MKVICIRENSTYFTIGKIYDVEDIGDFYVTTNDKGYFGLQRKDIFKDIIGERNKKLESLGI